MTTVATTNPQEAKAAENPQEVLASGGPAIPAPEYNGLLFQIPGQKEIYLVLNGYLRHVPDWPTFQRLFANAPIKPADAIDWISKGPALTKGAMLIRGKDVNKTYLLTDKVKMWIPNTTIFEGYHFDMTQCLVDPQIVVDFIPDGPNVEGPHK
jgi:hypothetical protein